MTKQFAIALISAALIAPAYAAPENYTMDPAHTIPSFEVNHLGFTTQRGRFDKADGKVTLDMAARKGSVELTIHTGSLDMGSASWTAHLSDEGLFNVKAYPTMSFKSDHLIFDGDNRVVAAEGSFTLIGVTKPLLVTVSGFKCGINPMNKKPLCAGDVTANIKRSEFGLTKYLGAVSDEVKIIVPVEAYKD
ncbi:MAG: YceI family protein [Rhodocyclaceae bacterium]|nr:YceI family protein [Rhodocyclaceae bacterium]